ncbi:hypothetical protein [Haloferax prahovense]|uniref:hypothetical protein n=1 Tax=Haloferax prahovense TaxID=381852 RepID=UPI00126793F1|nr:hypothetical protein [Haloferax prahovense]
MDRKHNEVTGVAKSRRSVLRSMGIAGFGVTGLKSVNFQQVGKTKFIEARYEHKVESMSEELKVASMKHIDYPYEHYVDENSKQLSLKKFARNSTVKLFKQNSAVVQFEGEYQTPGPNLSSKSGTIVTNTGSGFRPLMGLSAATQYSAPPFSASFQGKVGRVGGERSLEHPEAAETTVELPTRPVQIRTHKKRLPPEKRDTVEEVETVQVTPQLKLRNHGEVAVSTADAENSQR